MRIPSRARGEEGAAAVEFALIVGVFCLLLFGMLEFGVAFWQTQNLRSATREAAREAAVRGQYTDIQANLIAASNKTLPPGYTGFTVDVTGPVNPHLCTRDTTGQNVKVAIVNSQLPPSAQQAFSINIPFIPPIPLNPDLSGTFRCE